MKSRSEEKAINGLGRVAFLPFCEVALKAAKPRDYPTEPRTLGEHLQKRRRETGLIQKEVAVRLGINAWTVFRWENGNTNPPVRYLPRIIEFLGDSPLEEP